VSDMVNPREGCGYRLGATSRPRRRRDGSLAPSGNQWRCSTHASVGRSLSRRLPSIEE
jgi:hypothetical protein